jgi:hypothetical protein
MCEGKKLLRVSLMQQSDPSKPENEAAKIGQTVEILIGGQTYYGKCVGKNGSPSSLNLFTRNGSPQITNSKAYTDASDMMFFVEMEDDSVYDMIPESPEDKSVTPIAQFRGKEIHGAIVVPVKGLYSERDQANEAAGKGNKYFVWKITDEGLVKQYVELYETKVITENKMVLSGLSEGDKIAIEGN